MQSNGCQSGCRLSKNDAEDENHNDDGPTQTSPPRDDGRCGRFFGGAICDPNGKHGGCCSEYGYCGNTDGHCLPPSCQSGCRTATASATGPTDTGEPVLARPTTATGPQPTGAITTDGNCGVDFNYTMCGDWYKGRCCSMYGYCGSTSSHCGEGCQRQSGECEGVEPAPGPRPAPIHSNPGSFKQIADSGVPAMHAGLLPNGKVAFYDKVENYTQLKLDNGQYAYAAEYDPSNGRVTGLSYKTNAFCAGGVFLADGTFLSIGGNGPLEFIDRTVGDGFRGLRFLRRSIDPSNHDDKDWEEPGKKLNTARWYASAQIMADGRVFVASGSFNGLNPSVSANNNPSFEILSREGAPTTQSIRMELLVRAQPYYMYPFIHLMPDSNLFIFASKSSELFNSGLNRTIREYPDLIGDYRTYPNTGGSVLLPLSSSNNWAAEILICGGGAYQDIVSPTEPSCGRIMPLSQDPKWEMDAMPEGRGMVEATLLPDGTVIWLNGCNYGAQGFGLAKDPTTEALIYDPAKPLGQRFSRGARSPIARLYHSVALLLLDGTVLVAGSNPVEQPILRPSAQNPFVTDFRVEIYTPPYLSGDNAQKRPINVHLGSKNLVAKTNSKFTITFSAVDGARGAKIALYHGGFVTHSLHMGHRMLFLDHTGWSQGGRDQTLEVSMPDDKNLAPPGPYVVYVLVDGVPAIGQTVLVS
ncbi:galactose oxidase [Pseudovirgaria hyperparasitica]|uniref:Galactose oxidase n=1 Tax=Pseudovirgaria hyperparasitica TaxID=470096 RepID=A0A6A6W3W2_9PEZI|nr:galactose oxidase [Pseudovirgaria hyperparasitica]KAF2757542.1 galactose oxidase [Pseudovirgaria hyperparasitica]